MLLRAAILLTAFALPAQAATDTPVLLIKKARVVETTPVATTAAGYLSITNDSDTTYALTKIEAGDIGAELHETKAFGDVTRMEHHENGFEIAPGETLELSRGGRHIMFTGMAEPLRAGDSVKATLIFTDEVRVPVTFEVVTLENETETTADRAD